MIIRYFTIAGGNRTALVFDCSQELTQKTASELLEHVEQVGFVREEPLPSLRMMGGELCINALLAFAYTREMKQGTIYLEPGNIAVMFKTEGTFVSITLTLPYTLKDNMILFDTIGYLCTQENQLYPKKFFVARALEYQLPAFGVVHYNKQGAIVPMVYVKDTNSLVSETACGSGSIAVAITTLKSTITQPTGKSITVIQTGTDFTITAEIETPPRRRLGKI